MKTGTKIASGLKQLVIFLSIIAMLFVLGIMIYHSQEVNNESKAKDEFYNASVWTDTVNSRIDGKLEPMFIKKRSADGRFYFIFRKSDKSSFSIPSLKQFSVGTPVIVTNTHYQMNSLGVIKELFEILPFESK